VPSISWSLGGGTGEAFRVSLSSDQTLAVSAQWATAGADIDLYVADDACDDLADLVYGRCSVWAGAAGTSARPETLSVRLRAGAYRVWVLNAGNTGDAGVAGTLDFALTP
jgi:hypothetical protein